MAKRKTVEVLANITKIKQLTSEEPFYRLVKRGGKILDHDKNAFPEDEHFVLARIVGSETKVREYELAIPECYAGAFNFSVVGQEGKMLTITSKRVTARHCAVYARRYVHAGYLFEFNLLASQNNILHVVQNVFPTPFIQWSAHLHSEKFEDLFNAVDLAVFVKNPQLEHIVAATGSPLMPPLCALIAGDKVAMMGDSMPATTGRYVEYWKGDKGLIF
ncbi:MAG: hypothetical protein HYT16_02935 [DPANN group archaeon]|nr:hypothetical protein [DPANN group archaeon]